MFIYKYKYSHDRRRNQMKSLLNEGKATLVQNTREGSIYKLCFKYRISNKGNITPV